MATAGDGMTPYQSGGAGGKLRKKPIRRSAPATPYDRPPTALRNNNNNNHNPSLFSKLVDPASRLIYAGADRLFGVFRKRLPSIPAQRPPDTSEEPRNGIQEEDPNSGSKTYTGVLEPSTNEGGNLASISASTEISDLEKMLQQKTFTRSEIERLTALLHARTTEPDVAEGDRPKLPNTTSHLLRLEASTSGPLSKHVDDRENFHTTISTPVVNARVFDEDVASPAELAKAYMGTRPAKVLSPSTLRFGSQAPRQDSALLNKTTILPRTPITSLVPRAAGTLKGYENGFTTPRSRGRSAIYNMARTPYYRGPSTFSQKGVASPSLISSQPALEQEELIGSSKMAVKRRSSALDDIGSGGPIRRIRQKASLLSQGSALSKHKSEFASSQKLKAVEENGETSRRNLGYASVPTESTQMASKIFEQLERMSPKEKPSGSRLGLGSMDKVDSPKYLLSSQDNQKSEGQHHVRSPDARESTSQNKDKVEENIPRKFAVPHTVLSSRNVNSMVTRGNSLIVTNNDSKLKLPAEPPQKKRAFFMSANEDSLEVDAGNRSNGHVSILLTENTKPGTSVFANKDVSAEVIQTPALPVADKVSGSPEFKKLDAPKSLFGSPGGSVVKKQEMEYNFHIPSSSNTQPDKLSQSILKENTVVQQKEPTVFPTFGTSTTSADKASPFSFSANKPSGVESNISPDAKPLGSTSSFNSASNNNDNGNTQKSVNIFDKIQASSSASPATTSGIFSFGGSAKNTTNGTSSPSVFASSSPIPASGTNTNKLFGSSSALFSSTTTTTAAAAPSATSSASPTSATTPAPLFSFGLTSVAKAPETTAPKEKEPSSSLFNSTAATGGSIFGFSSSSTTSTTNGNSQNTQASSPVTQAVPFQFGSSTTSLVSGTTATPPTTSGSSLFGSPAPSFGLASAVSSSVIKTGSSTSNPTTNVFGSGLNPAPSFGLGSAVASSTSGSSASIFGSTAWQPPQSSAFGSSSPFSFGASSTPSVPSATTPPTMFGSSNNTGASTGSSVFSFSAAGATSSSFPSPVFGNPTPVFGASPNNNDQMSMEDSMAEDSTHTPSPLVPSFPQASGGTPGFMFGSGNPTSSPVPFQFGGQTSQPQQQTPQPLSQNPFQASGSVDFNTGGSFSLGSGGGGDKSGRRILRVKSKNRRK